MTKPLESLLKMIKKHNINPNLSLETLIDQIAGLSSEHAQMLALVENSTKGKFLEAVVPTTLFTTCPDCGSHTLLNFTDCHLCGFTLVDAEVDTAPVVADKKVDKVAKPADKPAAKVADKKVADKVVDKEPAKESVYKKKNATEEIIFEEKKAEAPIEDDLDLELDPDFESAAKQTKAKPADKKKEPVVDDFDAEFDFDDEPKTTKAKPADKVKEEKAKVTKTADKTPPKKEEPKDELDIEFDDEPLPEEKPKTTTKAPAEKAAKGKGKAAPKVTEPDPVLGELNDEFDISDFDEEFEVEGADGEEDEFNL